MSKRRDKQPAERLEREVPRGVKLLRTLKGHADAVYGVAFDPTGRRLASGSSDKTVKLWDAGSGRLLHTLGHRGLVYSVAFNPDGGILASGSADQTIRLWDAASGKLLRTLNEHRHAVLSIVFNFEGRVLASAGGDATIRLWDVTSGRLLRTIRRNEHIVRSVAFDPQGRVLASGGDDRMIKLWDVASGRLLRTIRGSEHIVLSVAFDPQGLTLASGDTEETIKLWDVASGRLLRTMEGHTNYVEAVAFSADGRLLASKSKDETLRLWKCENWDTAAVIPEPTVAFWAPSLACHPSLPLLATSGSELNSPAEEKSELIHIWELDFDVLLGKTTESKPSVEAVHHTTAKVVLVGDSGVGKTGLGWRLAHKEYKEHSSTHGQQFWVVDELGTRRKDGTECEAILWDLAGQPDYRLTHALFLDDADLALVLFDPTDSRDPLHGVEFWLKQLKSGRKKEGEGKDCCPTILVGARSDRGEARLTKEELDEFCRQRGIGGGYLATSAKEGGGVKELLRLMKQQIAWEEKAATVTTVTFKRIKDYVLGLKENRRRRKVIVSPQELRQRLEKTDKAWEFTDAEMMTAVGHLANYGYVRVLRTSKGEERVLLSPELLNNLAASFVLEARRNQKGLGSLEEKQLLEGRYSFRELEKLSQEERDILLDSAALLFLEHNVCFRETDLAGQSYLVFPELINLKKPLLEDEETADGVAYTVAGAVENVYASLVVLLGYTQTFTRTNQWQNQARYVMGDGSICGFRQENSQDGELELVLYFGVNVPRSGRKVFEGLFENFLARRNVTVFRYEPVVCKNGHVLNRAVVRNELRDGNTSAFCSKCGERVALPRADDPVQLTQTERRKVEEQRRVAQRRTRFEQAVFQVMSYVKDQKLKVPECFISYAWGEHERERWVERNLAADLQKAGINVVLDRWENDRGGKSVSRFVSRIGKCDIVIPVGTPLYFEKFENRVSSTGSVVASEVDLISQRLMGTEEEKETVIPVLLAGVKKSSLPPLMWDRVHRDFTNEKDYFITAFNLILDLYDIPHTHQAVADLRESLRDADALRSLT